MRTDIGTIHKAILISLSIAAGLGGCGGPPVRSMSGPLSKDAGVPLLLIVEKNGDYWCPVEVVSVSEEQCGKGAPPAGPDHLACRNHNEPIRWFAHDKQSHTNPGADANFTITFDTDKKSPTGKCSQSEDGALDCKIRWRIPGTKDPEGTYHYIVTMTPPPTVPPPSPCKPLDPRIYVNP